MGQETPSSEIERFLGSRGSTPSIMYLSSKLLAEPDYNAPWLAPPPDDELTTTDDADLMSSIRDARFQEDLLEEIEYISCARPLWQPDSEAYALSFLPASRCESNALLTTIFLKSSLFSMSSKIHVHKAPTSLPSLRKSFLRGVLRLKAQTASSRLYITRTCLWRVFQGCSSQMSRARTAEVIESIV